MQYVQLTYSLFMSLDVSESNYFSVDATINVMHIGLRTKIGAFSLFSNVKTNFDFKGWIFFYNFIDVPVQASIRPKWCDRQ